MNTESFLYWYYCDKHTTTSARHFHFHQMKFCSTFLFHHTRAFRSHQQHFRNRPFEELYLLAFLYFDLEWVTDIILFFYETTKLAFFFFFLNNLECTKGLQPDSLINLFWEFLFAKIFSVWHKHTLSSFF